MTRFILTIGLVAMLGAGAASLVLVPERRHASPQLTEVEYVPYDRAAVPRKTVKPDYPARALREGLEGTVYVKARVGTAGYVKQAVVLASDNPVFNQAAVIATMKWEFQPALQDGAPVETWVPVPIRFRLRKDADTVEYTVSSR